MCLIYILKLLFKYFNTAYTRGASSQRHTISISCASVAPQITFGEYLMPIGKPFHHDGNLVPQFSTRCH